MVLPVEVLESSLDAELGDDEYIEDPTVNNLEDECAKLLGFDKGLFVSSGLMGNQISLLIHNDPGTEVITPHDSHIKNYEHGAAAFLSRVQFRDAEHTDGELNLDYVEKLILKSKVHKPIIKTVSIENTHLASGGSIVPFDSIKSLSKMVREYDLKLHVDGARVWHAIQEDKDSVNYGDYCDSLTFCFSKALGAPIGSMLLGTEQFIKEAREYRKKLGGGMRQAGMMAAAGIYALENNIDRLREDHRRARQFAEALVDMPNFSVNLEAVQSNIVYIGVGKGQSKRAIEELAKHGIDILDTDDSTIRAVFHLHITDEDLEKAIEAFEQIR